MGRFWKWVGLGLSTAHGEPNWSAIPVSSYEGWILSGLGWAGLLPSLARDGQGGLNQAVASADKYRDWGRPSQIGPQHLLAHTRPRGTSQ